MSNKYHGEDLQAWRNSAGFSPDTIFRHFTLYHSYESGGCIWLMDGLRPDASDYCDLVDIARIWASEGKEIFILAPVHFKDPLYSIIYGSLAMTRFFRKCPDLLVDGNFYEYESFRSPWSKKKISHMLKQGYKQSSRLIVNNNKGGSHRFYRSRIHARIAASSDIEELWIYERGDLVQIYKRNRETR